MKKKSEHSLLDKLAFAVAVGSRFTLQLLDGSLAAATAKAAVAAVKQLDA